MNFCISRIAANTVIVAPYQFIGTLYPLSYCLSVMYMYIPLYVLTVLWDISIVLKSALSTGL